MLERVTTMLPFLVPLVLMGCASLQEKCVDRAGARVRNLEERIEVAQGNIDRGYAVHVSRSQATVGFCSGSYGGYSRYGGISTCIASDPGPREQAVPINVVEERAKLDALRAALVQEQAVYRNQVASCRVAFPE
ncbi:hypothetical protein [Alloyangia pacifica]|uniref:Uncharacterized protein n=1 Tax=Alloyangia pacifica TaxID=311180 RepID=A0A1I6SXL6_9RHOB|nr:hypothetical protein [Alloyangia pacifica]SDG90705.1 hypothetical protein SAMN04488245_105126 [Alloyangia pacifica]SFS81659.1 hypothetical protein SAMN04488050_105126 [Alloyangia pacifica]